MTRYRRERIMVGSILLTLLILWACEKFIAINWTSPKGLDTRSASVRIGSLSPSDSIREITHPPNQPAAPPARSAFASTLNTAEAITDPQQRRDALVRACFDEATHDPAEAVAAADFYSLDRGSGGVLENLIVQWSLSDLGATCRWIDDRPRGPQEEALAARAAVVWSKTDPPQAASWLLQVTDPGPKQEDAVISVLHQWAQKDLPGAYAWVAQFPPGTFHARAAHELEGMAPRDN